VPPLLQQIAEGHATNYDTAFKGDQIVNLLQWLMTTTAILSEDWNCKSSIQFK